jgi:hypothetical protein
MSHHPNINAASALKNRLQRFRLIGLATLSTALLMACSGGGSDTPAVPPVVVPPVAVDPLTPAAQTDLDKVAALYGIEANGVGGDSGGDGGAAGDAGDGAPLKRVNVTLTDSKGNIVSGKTDDNGRYLLKYKTAVFSPPFVVRTVDAGGSVLTSVSEETVTAGKVLRASINPLTDKITSDILSPTVLGTDKAFDGSKVDVSKLAKAKADLLASVEAGLKVAGIAETGKFDPIKSIYKYDGNGVDAVLESISHARDAQTGATQLRAKLAAVQTDATGTVIPTLITASTPLGTTSVAVSTNPGLTFSKLNNWVTQVNRCLALTATARKADAICSDPAAAPTFVSPNFQHNSKDFDENYRTLLSESDRSAVQGSTFKNPNVLFTTRSTNSTVDDIAVVEVTVNQPRTGPLAGSVAAEIEYTTIAVFKRDDTLTKATAGNWILYGNQRTYDNTLRARYLKNIQNNPLKQANSTGNSPSTFETQINFNFSTTKFDPTIRAYVSANVRAVRVKGPGLPAAGLVLTPNSVPGSSAYMTIHNKTGVVGTASMAANVIASPNFRLSAVASDGAPLYAGYWPAGGTGTPGVSGSQSYADVPLTDFSALQAYSQYRMEIFLNSNPGNTAPDLVETTTILSPVIAPANVRNVQLNDLTPSAALVTAPEAGGCSFNLAWTNNPNAAPVASAFIFGSNSSRNAIIGATPNASLVGTRISSITATASGCTPGAATPSATSIPSLANVPGNGDFRQVGIRSDQARYQFYTYLNWNN